MWTFPADLSSSTIKMLMSDDDKCLSSPVICAALTDRRLLRCLVGRSQCATVWAAGPVEPDIANCREPFYCSDKYWRGLEKQIGQSTILLFVSLLRKSENWERLGTKCSTGNLIHCEYWDGGVHCYFQELKSTSVYSLLLSDRRRQSAVWWITEKETV